MLSMPMQSAPKVTPTESLDIIGGSLDLDCRFQRSGCSRGSIPLWLPPFISKGKMAQTKKHKSRDCFHSCTLLLSGKAHRSKEKEICKCEALFTQLFHDQGINCEQAQISEPRAGECWMMCSGPEAIEQSSHKDDISSTGGHCLSLRLVFGFRGTWDSKAPDQPTPPRYSEPSLGCCAAGLWGPIHPIPAKKCVERSKVNRIPKGGSNR